MAHSSNIRSGSIALRYRLLECHSVERVDMFGTEGTEAVRLDPMLGLGDIRDTPIRWGTRRVSTSFGEEVMLYFQGLDYHALGRNRFLAAPYVLASNRDLPQRTRVGSHLHSIGSMGDWQCVLASVPTVYRPALVESEAMRILIGYMRSSVNGMPPGGRQGSLRDYLSHFPGARDASWIEGVGRVAFRPIAAVRQGLPQSGLAAFITFDAQRSRTASRSSVKRVLTELFESHRGINQVQETVVVSS